MLEIATTCQRCKSSYIEKNVEAGMSVTLEVVPFAVSNRALMGLMHNAAHVLPDLVYRHIDFYRCERLRALRYCGHWTGLAYLELLGWLQRRGHPESLRVAEKGHRC